MHPLRHPRNAVVVGLMFLVAAGIYVVWPMLWGGYFEPSGLVLLILLGVAMSIMAYVLIAGSPRD